MTIGILVTNNGPHPPEKWAEATASHIVDIADHVAGERRGAAIKLQAAIIDVLETHHATVQTGERAKIDEHGADRLAHPLDPGEHLSLDGAVKEIVAAAKGTPWEADFAASAMTDHLRTLLGSHFCTSMHIERSWHADRNPDTEQARAFRAAYHPGE